MRAFVLIGHTQPLEPDFSLDDLPGSAGRMDVLCRNLTAALLLSHGIRTDVSVWIVIQDELTIEVNGDEVRHLRPDERSTGALFRDALETAVDRVVSSRPVESRPGVYVRRQGLAATLEALDTRYQLVHLRPDAPELSPSDTPDSPAFILSDHRPFTTEEDQLIGSFDPQTYSLGLAVIHGDQAIAVAHNLVDRADESAYSGTGDR